LAVLLFRAQFDLPAACWNFFFSFSYHYPSGGVLDGRLRALVFSFHYVLAVGFGGSGALSNRVADATSFSVGRNCGAWSARLGVGLGDVASSTAQCAVSAVARLSQVALRRFPT
jgi:hypothetical protein